MALQLHILGVSPPEAPYLEVTVAFWIDVPSQFQTAFADPAATSRVPWATAAEVASLRTGQRVEVVETLRWSDPPTPATIVDLLKQRAKTLWAEVATTKGVPTAQNVGFWRARLRYDGATDTWSVVP